MWDFSSTLPRASFLSLFPRRKRRGLRLCRKGLMTMPHLPCPTTALIKAQLHPEFRGRRRGGQAAETVPHGDSQDGAGVNLSDVTARDSPSSSTCLPHPASLIKLASPIQAREFGLRLPHTLNILTNTSAERPRPEAEAKCPQEGPSRTEDTVSCSQPGSRPKYTGSVTCPGSDRYSQVPNPRCLAAVTLPLKERGLNRQPRRESSKEVKMHGAGPFPQNDGWLIPSVSQPDGTKRVDGGCLWGWIPTEMFIHPCIFPDLLKRSGSIPALAVRRLAGAICRKLIRRESKTPALTSGAGSPVAAAQGGLGAGKASGPAWAVAGDRLVHAEFSRAPGVLEGVFSRRWVSLTACTGKGPLGGQGEVKGEAGPARLWEKRVPHRKGGGTRGQPSFHSQDLKRTFQGKEELPSPPPSGMAAGLGHTSPNTVLAVTSHLLAGPTRTLRMPGPYTLSGNSQPAWQSLGPRLENDRLVTKHLTSLGLIKKLSGSFTQRSERPTPGHAKPSPELTPPVLSGTVISICPRVAADCLILTSSKYKNRPDAQAQHSVKVLPLHSRPGMRWTVRGTVQVLLAKTSTETLETLEQRRGRKGGEDGQSMNTAGMWLHKQTQNARGPSADSARRSELPLSVLAPCDPAVTWSCSPCHVRGPGLSCLHAGHQVHSSMHPAGEGGQRLDLIAQGAGTSLRHKLLTQAHGSKTSVPMPLPWARVQRFPCFLREATLVRWATQPLEQGVKVERQPSQLRRASSERDSPKEPAPLLSLLQTLFILGTRVPAVNHAVLQLRVCLQTATSNRQEAEGGESLHRAARGNQGGPDEHCQAQAPELRRPGCTAESQPPSPT
ncbi:hypothetical protein Cadr_000029923 [Camelus dromedarius]|uniref:Uncharacterized protein n=1 Tax=Camelus dromedarius TaxID=9838 RepID=A0A5N4CE97_CAMDR|nr:hypothetical protein Cadr_000029923 [Camelus dromedarius]